jgi:drug/metabolite transporter (DMT)-like permease
VLAATPMAVAVFDRIFFKKMIHWTKMAGIGFGILGVALLY